MEWNTHSAFYFKQNTLVDSRNRLWVGKGLNAIMCLMPGTLNALQHYNVPDLLTNGGKRFEFLGFVLQRDC
jgi:hypothetical protein